MKKNKYHQRLAELAIPAVYALPIPAAFFNCVANLKTLWCYDVAKVMGGHPRPHIQLLAAALVLKYWHYDSGTPSGGPRSPGGPKAPEGAGGPEGSNLADHPLCTFNFCYLPVYAHAYLEEIYRLLRQTLQVISRVAGPVTCLLPIPWINAMYKAL